MMSGIGNCRFAFFRVKKSYQFLRDEKYATKINNQGIQNQLAPSKSTMLNALSAKARCDHWSSPSSMSFVLISMQYSSKYLDKTS